MTAFQQRQAAEVSAERNRENQMFANTGATAMIGIVSNIPGTYTVNTLHGPRKRNYENRPFPSATEALKSYARQFGTGTLKKMQHPAGEFYLIHCA